MNALPPERPVQVVLDVTKPLFDAHGNPHHVIICSAFQLLTTFRGLFFLWDRCSGASLMSDGSPFRLSNEPALDSPSIVRVTSDNRLQMKQSSVVIDCLRRSSRAEVRGWSGRRRTDGAGQS